MLRQENMRDLSGLGGVEESLEGPTMRQEGRRAGGWGQGPVGGDRLAGLHS